MPLLTLAALPAMISTAPPARELDETLVSPGLLGLSVVLALAAATWLLIRSMNRQIRKVDCEEGPAPGRTGGADPAG